MIYLIVAIISIFNIVRMHPMGDLQLSEYSAGTVSTASYADTQHWRNAKIITLSSALNH